MDVIQLLKPTLSQIYSEIYGRGNSLSALISISVLSLLFFFCILECVSNTSHAISNFLINAISTKACVSFLLSQLCRNFSSPIVCHLMNSKLKCYQISGDSEKQQKVRTEESSLNSLARWDYEICLYQDAINLSFILVY